MSSTYVNYSQINSMEEFAFIAGTDYTLVFNVLNADGTPQNIGGATVYITFSPFGQSYNVLQITGSLVDDYSFEVEIPASSTVSFSGKYIIQPVIHSFYGQKYVPAQGTVLIIPKTPLN